jgi:hypothetical protein
MMQPPLQVLREQLYKDPPVCHSGDYGLAGQGPCLLHMVKQHGGREGNPPVYGRTIRCVFEREGLNRRVHWPTGVVRLGGETPTPKWKQRNSRGFEEQLLH